MESHSDTRDKLLDAAEVLFAEGGVQATSLRAITRRAGANLAAVNYHFGSKDGLVQAVFRRRLEPVNEERLRMLTEAEEAAGPEGPGLEEVLRAFFEPVLRYQYLADSEEGGDGPEATTLRRLMGRTFSEPGLEMQRLMKGQFEVVVRRFKAALARCVPQLPPRELLWRLHFMVGSIIQVALNGTMIYEISGGRCDPRDVETLTGLMVAYARGGLEAPASLVAEADPPTGDIDSLLPELRPMAAEQRDRRPQRRGSSTVSPSVESTTASSSSPPTDSPSGALAATLSAGAAPPRPRSSSVPPSPSSSSSSSSSSASSPPPSSSASSPRGSRPPDPGDSP